jgi:hypothetical protein
MKKFSLVFLVCAVAAASAAPLWAGTAVIQSNASNTGAAVASASDPRLTSGDTSGLNFTVVGTDNLGSFTSAPSGAPAGTIPVQVPPECGWYCGQSGFVETTFTLPTGFTAASLTGAANVDDSGYAFLNGYLISSQLSELGNTSFSTSNQLYFDTGVNTFVISDSNSGGGPSAVAFYANINYTSPTPVPEGPALPMLGICALALLGAMVIVKRGLIAY